MGITGELVRSVFARNRSAGTQDSNDLQTSINVVEKRRWSSVRSYLCGDEFNSVLAEEDSTSVKSSEATVTQPIPEDLTDKGDIQNQEINEKHISISKLFHEEDAAIIIQREFRSFLARRQHEENKSNDGTQEPLAGIKSPTRESVSTSIEVQTGNSVEIFSLREERTAVPQKMHQKTRTQILRIKEDWDDSTVSSNVSKMRIQSRMEATTRRERALAYAFSQQLRICSKKKQAKTDGTEINMGWSWLERWMATRVPESTIENQISKQLEPSNHNKKVMVTKKLFDVAGEEKESCGSNEVSIQLDSLSFTAGTGMDGSKPSKKRLKATRSVSRRKTVPSYHQCPKESTKISKTDYSKESDIDKKNKQKQAGSKKEIKCKDASS